MIKHPSARHMRLCLEEAAEAFRAGEYPIAALVVVGDEVLSKRHTSLEDSHDPTAHAEILAIRETSALVQSRYIEGGYLYTTCEPCPMCTSAAIFAKLAGIIYCTDHIDVNEVSARYPDIGLSWRRIAIPTRDVIEKGEPKPVLYPRFLRDEGLSQLEMLLGDKKQGT